MTIDLEVDYRFNTIGIDLKEILRLRKEKGGRIYRIGKEKIEQHQHPIKTSRRKTEVPITQYLKTLITSSENKINCSSRHNSIQLDIPLLLPCQANIESYKDKKQIKKRSPN